MFMPAPGSMLRCLFSSSKLSPSREWKFEVTHYLVSVVDRSALCCCMYHMPMKSAILKSMLAGWSQVYC